MKMKKIKVEIEISNIESWSVNWANKDEASEELEKLRLEIKTAIIDDIGIYFDNLKITKCEISS